MNGHLCLGGEGGLLSLQKICTEHPLCARLWWVPCTTASTLESSVSPCTKRIVVRQRCQKQLSPLSTFSHDLEASGKAGLACDRDPLCPGQVTILPGFPAGVSAAVPDPQPYGRLLWAPQFRVGRLGFLEQGVEPGMEQRSH